MQWERSASGFTPNAAFVYKEKSELIYVLSWLQTTTLQVSDTSVVAFDVPLLFL